LEVSETPKEISFCQFAIQDNEIYEVEDASQDNKFKDNPLVTSNPNIRFYASYPIIDPQGYALGTLCVIDQKPKKLNEKQKKALKYLAEEVMANILSRYQKEVLRESEYRYRQVVEAHSDFILISEPDTTITFANESLCKSLGVTQEQILGLKWINFAEPHDLQPILEKIKALSPQNPSFFTENRDKRKDDTWGWTQWLNQGIFDGKGKLSKIQSVGRDITSLKQAELLSKESEAKLQSILHSMISGVVVINTLGEITFANESASKILSLEKKDIKGRYYSSRDWKQINEDGSPFPLDKLPLALALTKQENVYNIEHGIVAEGEQVRWLTVNASPLYNEQRQLIGAVASFKDITEHKLAEKQIKESEERMRMVANATLDAYYDWDMVSNHVWRNEGYVNLFGSPNEIEKTSDWWIARIHPEDRNVIIESMDNAFLNKSHHWSVEYRFLRKNNQYAFVLDRGLIIYDHQNKPIRFLGAIIDLTEIKETKLALEQSQRKLQDIATAVDGVVWEVDAETYIFTYVSPKVVEILGYDIEEWYKPNFWASHIYQEDKENAVNFCFISTNKLENHDFEYRFVKKNGELVWIRDIVTVVPENGKPKWLRGIMIDITKQKQAELEIITQTRRLTDIIEGTNVGTWEWSVQNGETIFNEKWANIIGYTLSEIQPVSIQTWVHFTHPDDLKISGEMLEKHFSGELEYYECEARMKHKDGHWVWVLDRGKVVSWTKEGKPLLMSGTHQDITKRKKDEEILQQLNEELIVSEEELRVSLEEILEAKQALEKTESLLRSSIEANLDAVFILKSKRNEQGEVVDFIFHEVNQNACLLLGVTEKDVKEYGICELFPLHEELGYFNKYKNVFLTQTSDEGEFYIPFIFKKSGWYYRQISPMPEGIVMSVRDVSEKRTLQQQLIETNQLAKVGGWEVDLVTGKNTWSSITKEIHEVEPDYEPSLQTAINFYKEGHDRELISNVVKEGIENGVPWDVELRIITAKGNEKWVRAQGKAEFMYGKCVRIYGAFQDIDIRKKAEEILHFHSHILQNITNGLHLVKEDGIIVYANDIIEKMFGYDNGELLGKHVSILNAPTLKDPIETTNDIIFTIRTKGSWRGEIQNIKKDGTVFWCEATVTEFIHPDFGKAWLSVHQDITERKIAEEKLATSQKLFQTMADNAPVLIWISDTNKLCTYFNKVWLDFTGRTLEEEYGNGWTEMVHPDDLQRCWDTYSNAFDNQQQFFMDYRLKRYDGEYRWLADHGIPLKTSSGEFLGYIGSCIDITERKKLEEERRDIEIKLKAISDSTDDGNLLIGKNLEILYFNKATANYIQYYFKETIKVGDSILKFQEPETTKLFLEYFNKALQGEAVIHETSYTFPTRDTIWFEVKYLPVYNQENQLIGVSFTSVNINPRKKAELDLAQSEKHLKELLNGMPVGVYTTDAQGFITFYNKAAVQLWGRVPTLYKEKWCGSYKLYDKEGNFIEHQDCPMGVALRTSQQIYGVEAMLEQPEGKKLNFLAHATPFYDEKGILKGAMNVMVDITERKKIESALAESELKNRLIIENSTVGILFASPNGDVFSANAEACKILQMTEEEICEKGRKGITAYEEEVKTIIEYRARYGSYKGEIFMVRKTGEVFPADIITTKFTLPNGLESVTVIFRDITRRKKMEKAIRDNEQFLTNLIGNLPGYVYRVNNDPDYTPIYISQQVEKITEYSQDDYLIHRAISCGKEIHPEDADRVWDIVQNAISQKTAYDCEYKIISKSNKIKWVWEKGKGIYDEKGNLLYLEGFVMDITSEKRAQIENEKLLERLEKLADNVPGVIYQYNLDSNNNSSFPYISKYAENLLGVKVEELMSDGGAAFRNIHEEDIERLILSIQKSKNNLSTWSEEFRIVKQRKITWLEASSKPHLQKDGSVIWYGFMADITKRKLMEERVSMLSMVAKRTSNAVVITDANRRITWVNDGFTRITGFTFPEAVGKKPSEFLQFEKTDPKTIELLREKLSKAENVQCEILNIGKNGKEYWLLLEIQPLFNEKGVLTGFAAIETDITERKKLTQDLENLLDITRNQNQRLREYTYITSHNIRSPLSSMMGLCNMLKDEPNNPLYLEMLNTSVNQLDFVIRKMNELLTIENDSKTIAKSKVNLLEAIQQNKQLIQNLFVDSNVSLRLEIPNDLEVSVIPAYLDSILNNFMTNAIKYRRRNIESWIRIEAHREKDAVIMTIEDNGLGIDLRKYGQKLFKMNSRFHLQVEGKGIGLFLTKYQIEAMGGKITVESTPNQGTTFKIWFYENN
jgi:PAS domain S-box-containing protein